MIFFSRNVSANLFFRCAPSIGNERYLTVHDAATSLTVGMFDDGRRDGGKLPDGARLPRRKVSVGAIGAANSARRAAHVCPPRRVRTNWPHSPAGGDAGNV